MMLRLYTRIAEWLRQEEGQDLIEYALILALLSLVATASIMAVGDDLPTLWQNASTQLGTAITAIGA